MLHENGDGPAQDRPDPLQTPDVLTVSDLRSVFHTGDGTIHAVNGIGFSLCKGELLAIVGESGSGKSVAMMSLVRLLPSPPAEIVTGRVLFRGTDLLRLPTARMREIRGAQIGFVFQDPMTSLNPVFTVGFQIMEELRTHLGYSRTEARRRAIELLELVGIPAAAKRVDDYPHQFSGGMRQRVMIAIAIACEPQLLIADEPTTALDVTVQAQIVELMRELRQRLGMAVVWVTHDLAVAAGISDRIMVMYGGMVMEECPTAELFDNPRHPYTRALLDCLPGRHRRGEALRSVPGQPPLLLKAPAGCPFAPRCPHAIEACSVVPPPLVDIGAGHRVACWWDAETDGEQHVH